MAHVDFLATEINKRYGAVTRARGCFLYTRKSVRLVDLYQEGGRAILGWGGHQFTIFKNILNRGITGSFDTDYLMRVSKAVQDLLGEKRAVFVFTEKSAAIRAGLGFSKYGTAFWRPWSTAPCTASESFLAADGKTSTGGCAAIEAAIVEPPLAWTQQIYILAVKQDIYEANVAAGHEIPVSVRIPAPLSAAVARSIYDLISEIPKRSEKNWFVYDKILTKYWTREGPYLFPKIPQEKYEEFICHCLDCEIITSADYNTPSIVPFGADVGVFRKLEKNNFDWQ